MLSVTSCTVRRVGSLVGAKGDGKRVSREALCSMGTAETQREEQGVAERDVVKVAVIRTNRHEGFGVETWLRHANAVDSKHPHFIQNTFNHPLGLICC